MSNRFGAGIPLFGFGLREVHVVSFVVTGPSGGSKSCSLDCDAGYLI